MREMLAGAGFTDIKIQIKENAADIISGWMPGTGAEKYVTSAYVTATKPLDGNSLRDDVHRLPDSSCCAEEQAGCCPDVKVAAAAPAAMETATAGC